MFTVMLGGAFLFMAVLIAVDFLLERTTPTSKTHARTWLYELWITTGTLKAYLR